MLSIVFSVFQQYIGVILPPIIDGVNSRISNSKLRFLVSLLICIGAAALLNPDQLLAGDVGEFLGTSSFIFAQAQIVYNTYWKKSAARVKMYGAGIGS